MKKPYWLKGSYIQIKVTRVLFSGIICFLKPREKTNKILITSFGGLGDIIVKQKLIDLIAKKHGKKNIIVLVGNNPEMIKIMGYDVIFFEKNIQKNIFKLLKIYKKILKNGFKILYSLETLGCSELYFLKNHKFDKIIGYRCEVLRKWTGKCEKVLIPTNKGKVLEVVYEFAQYVEKNIKKEFLRPCLDVKKNEYNYISIGVGASGRSRVSSPKKLGEFLNYVKNKNSEIKFHLLGNGKNEESYANELKKILGESSIVDFVGKIDLKGVIDEIANSKMYIGFDSGLYNMAYALNKKIILLASKEESNGFYHESKNIKIIFRENCTNTPYLEDLVYNNKEMNGIDLSSFICAYESFE